MKGRTGQHNWVFHTKWLRLALILLLVVGILLRITNLERKVYWHDEVESSRWIAGYFRQEVIQQVFNGAEIGVADLQKYQRISPDKGAIDTVYCVVVEAPYHSPFYYVLARFWAKIFGNSVLAMRSLPALISLLVFPAIFLLCLELFNSSLIGCVAMTLIAVSPFHVLYAQEVRQYSLLTVLILFSSIALLRAVRLTTKWSWGIYAITFALGLYTHAWFGLVAIAHWIYMATIQFKRSNFKSWSFPQTWINYFIATFCGLLAFAPWVFILIIKGTQVQGSTSWLSETISLTKLIKFWILCLSFPFFDPNGSVIYRAYEGSDSLFTYIIRLPIIALVFYSLYFLIKTSSAGARLFVFSLIGIIILAFVLPDLILGGIKSTVPRYLIPCYLGIHLAVAYLISVQISSERIGRQTIGKLIGITLILMGVISCIISSQAQAWWNKPASFDNLQVAHILNQIPQPLVISDSSDFNPSNTISLSYLLKPNTRFQLVDNPQQLKISNPSRDIFLLNPSESLKNYVKNELKYQIISVYKRGDSREISRLEKTQSY